MSEMEGWSSHYMLPAVFTSSFVLFEKNSFRGWSAIRLYSGSPCDMSVEFLDSFIITWIRLSHSTVVSGRFVHMHMRSNIIFNFLVFRIKHVQVDSLDNVMAIQENTSLEDILKFQKNCYQSQCAIYYFPNWIHLWKHSYWHAGVCKWSSILNWVSCMSFSSPLLCEANRGQGWVWGS